MGARYMRQARRDAVPFSPMAIPGVQMWLRSDFGIVQAANKVSQWSDKSGNGNHAVQAAGAAQPTFVSASSKVNNWPAVRFAGSGAIFMTHSLGSVASGFTIWAMICSDTGSGAANFQVLYGNNGGAFLLSNGTGTAGDWGCYVGQYTDSGHAVLDGNGHSCGWVCPTTAGTQTFCSDGVITTVAGLSAYTGASGQIGNGGGGVQGAACDVAELIAWNTQLSQAQLGLMHNYALARYGVG